MSEQTEPTVEQQIEQLTQQYARINLERAYQRHGGQPEKFPEFWERAKKSEIVLTEDHQITIGGRLADFYVGRERKSPEVEEHFFNFADRNAANAESTEAPQTQQGSSPAPRAAATLDVLYVSQTQLNDRRFMRAAGTEILTAIRDGRIAVNDSKAVQDVAEVQKFLAPKQAEPAPTAKPGPAPKRTTQITKAQAMNRNFTRKLEAEWSEQGGYLKNVQNGNIRIV
ncbi:hypothetical protein NIES2135_05030 [Leptolyngbya boryana NIES-2135]|jgi:hypothetical protein|uniref:Uncharacterized protein n=1 Tax=Leptolyngbya boryana NIES-2135 TaxID=1973484 RepID=A0A1Z4JAF5_LEPBY|nr:MULTISPECIES: hypothetical protein [Leptolyngbya]BAY53693.1 hypothetical protein NIES2135_05030 [Leptolyngbya boryana NIES-2135]MBD2367868.1 hypothetical protein [Leptolyngbya sp. FACHB-161]MBD2374284.1 hypothetical protein [Leptolyngbya sp. FACHB-238]MBD2398506.1 hypothetical protein [Leptolyngbya sp. FACHB-239]MBD2408320.1 hypothetical protein [Leptolyngbya sp. FACHB-402]